MTRPTFTQFVEQNEDMLHRLFRVYIQDLNEKITLEAFHRFAYQYSY